MINDGRSNIRHGKETRDTQQDQTYAKWRLVRIQSTLLVQLVSIYLLFLGKEEIEVLVKGYFIIIYFIAIYTVNFTFFNNYVWSISFQCIFLIFFICPLAKGPLWHIDIWKKIDVAWYIEAMFWCLDWSMGNIYLWGTEAIVSSQSYFWSGWLCEFTGTKDKNRLLAMKLRAGINSLSMQEHKNNFYYF